MHDGEKTVGEVMHAGVITCRPDDTLRTVAGLLAAHRIHAVVVSTADEDAACAVVSDRDIVFRHARGDLDRVTAREAANEPTVTIRADTELRHAAELMTRFGTSHVVVTEKPNGRPIGILSSLDIAAAAAEQSPG